MSAKGPELRPGDVVPGTKYRIVRSLGAGGMGVVYQVVKPPNIGGVLKLMSTELSDQEEHRTRFFDEVRILAQLEHPNIVKVFDYDALPDGTPFYVMELLSGRTVRDVIYTMGRVPPRVAYEITRQLLEALQCAHTHQVPVIHRDIKPENIFLHAPRHGEPVVKLIDFGVSSVADRKHDGNFVGTWSYAAPEQIRGERPTPATDLYAAGLVLYEMLAGVGPFDHYDDWAAIGDAQMKELPAPVSKFAPWVPPSIVTLIATALAKDPKVRPRDAYAFAEQLFELEWASDGKDPHDATVEGPGLTPPTPAPEAVAVPPVGSRRLLVGPRGTPVLGGAAPGAIAFALSTVTSANPSSKNMAASVPAADRLGDVPLIGVPPESVRAGPTWRGVGEARHEPTLPDADALLQGLGAEPRKPPSRRERQSDPEVVDASPRPGQVVIRAGRQPSAPHEERGPNTPRAMPVRSNTAITLDAESSLSPQPARAMPARDTFSSQQSDARAIPRSRSRSRSRVAIAALVSVAGVFLLVAVIAVVVRTRTHVETPAATVNATTSEPSAQALIPSARAAPVAPRALTTATESVVVPPPVVSAPTKPTPSQKPVGTSKPSAAVPNMASAEPHPLTSSSPSPATSGNGNGEFIRHF